MGGRRNSFTVAVKHPNDSPPPPLAEPDSAGYRGRKAAQKDLPFSISPGPLQGLNPFAVPIYEYLDVSLGSQEHSWALQGQRAGSRHTVQAGRRDPSDALAVSKPHGRVSISAGQQLALLLSTLGRQHF